MSAVDNRPRGEADAVECASYPPQNEGNEPNERISPAQGLNFDILSIIFVMVWESTVNSQLTVGAVCRSWREAALAIPQLWTRIFPDYESKGYTSLYLTRSRNLPLHIRIAKRSDESQSYALSTATDRITCLKLNKRPSAPFRTFPLLERLELNLDIIEHSLGDTDIMTLDASRYPNLRQLYLTSLPKAWLRAIAVTRGFPPLQSLYIGCNSNPYWKQIIRNCADTLVSISLSISGPSRPHFEVALPRLLHLWIMEITSYGILQLKLDAPRLQSVYRGVYNSTSSLTTLELHNMESVVNLQVWNAPLELHKYPQLRRLWIQSDVSRFDIVEDRLRDAMEDCHSIEYIRYTGLSMDMPADSLEDKSSELGNLILGVLEAASRRDIIVEEFDPSDLHLPGSLLRRAECEGMPCMGWD